MTFSISLSIPTYRYGVLTFSILVGNYELYTGVWLWRNVTHHKTAWFGINHHLPF